MTNAVEPSGLAEAAPDGTGATEPPEPAAIDEAPEVPRPALRREAIVEVATRLIEADGLDQLSLRKLAADLGVTAPALYAHVRDKEDLLAAVAMRAADEMVARFDTVVDDDPVVRIRGYARSYIEFSLERPQLFRTMFLFPLGLSGPISSESDTTETTSGGRAFERAFEATEAAIASGRFRDVDSIMAAFTVWTATHGLAEVLALGFDFDDAGREALVSSVLDTVLAGLAAPR